MHEGRPFGQHEIGEGVTDEDAAFAHKLMRQMTNFKDVSLLPSMKLVRTLPSGGQVIVYDMGGIRKVIMRPVQHDRPSQAPGSGRAMLRVPMLFSGVVDKPIVQPGEGVTLELTRTCGRRLRGYAGAGPARVKLQRFAIEYGPRHLEFKPENSSLLHSQYTDLYPSWFSGRAAALAQVALGYGMQDFEKLPEDATERAVMALPREVVRKAARELGFDADSEDAARRAPLLPGCMGWPPDDGQLRFDYEFADTNGVAMAGGVPWLVRVSAQGVFAMPLPMVPVTTTQAFREYVTQKGDAEIEWLLDTFGGMPSGEGFPPGEGFEAWRRAGVIVKVCETSNFYGVCGGYSSAMGWSFNTSGTQAVNTGWSFGGDGIQIGYAFMLSLSMGAYTDWGRVGAIKLPQNPTDAQQVVEYLNVVHQGLGNSDKHRAIKYKLRAAPTADLLSRARNRLATPKDEQDWWDKYEAPPIATCTGSLRQIAQGRVWAPGQPKSHPQIKFPEPWSRPPGCLSHDFGRLEGHPPTSGEVLCDTIMHAYFIEDDLKVAKYFRDGRSYFRDGEDNFDECMQVGSWEQTLTEGSTSIMGNFYTSDFDERKAAAPTTKTQKIVGTDLGFGWPMFSYDHFFSMVGSIWRNRYFRHDIHTEEEGGYSMMVALCVPYLEPHAVLHAFQDVTSGKTIRDSTQAYAVRDPNSYRYFTYDFVWAWVGGSTEGNMSHFTGEVNPSPYVSRNGQPVWVTGYNYNPGPCTDFADQGDWMGGLPQDYTWYIHPNANEWWHSGPDPEIYPQPKVNLKSKTTTEPAKRTGKLEISLDKNEQLIGRDSKTGADQFLDTPRSGYFEMSPNEYGDVFYVDAMRNEAGNAVYSSCSERESPTTPVRKHWGYTVMATDHKTAYRFIGVINE